MRQSKRTYTREFKIEAVKLSHTSDKNVEEVAEGIVNLISILPSSMP